LKERLSVEWGNIIEAITEVWGEQWDALATSRGNGAQPTAFLPGQRYGGLRLKEKTGKLTGSFEYPAVNAAIAGFERHFDTDRDLHNRFKR